MQPPSPRPHTVPVTLRKDQLEDFIRSYENAFNERLAPDQANELFDRLLDQYAGIKRVSDLADEAEAPHQLRPRRRLLKPYEQAPRKLPVPAHAPTKPTTADAPAEHARAQILRDLFAKLEKAIRDLTLQIVAVGNMVVGSR